MSTKSSVPQLVVVDAGSQYTLVIGRTYREDRYRTVILHPDKVEHWLAHNPVRGIIVSGSDASANDENAPVIPECIWEARTPEGNPVPKLFTCYGMHAVAVRFGGTVEKDPARAEYGTSPMFRKRNTPSRLLQGTPKEQKVLQSHGDSVTQVPEGWRVTALCSDKKTPAVIESLDDLNFAIQCHPEVNDTPFGKRMLRNFAHNICGLAPDWVPIELEESIQQEVLVAVGPTAHVIGGFSGGVDSTTSFRLLAPVLGDRLHGICIDGGQLQENEIEEILRHAKAAGVTIRIIEAHKEFQEALAGIFDAELKRKAFTATYNAIFLREVARWNAELAAVGKKIIFVLQGTLATDLIESAKTGGALIKTHHNSGPMGDLIRLDPLASLFKNEVRDLARSLGLPKSVSERQPSPGPGNFIRLIDAECTPENLATVAWGYARVRKILERYGLYTVNSQLVVGYFGTKLTGIKGDARVHEGFLGIHDLRSDDFMTGEGVIYPPEVVKELIKLPNHHPRISAVALFPCGKPPQTTEFQ